MTKSLRRRRGFTLIELLVGIILSGIIGIAMVQLIMSQTRFMDNQEAWRTARGVSRSGLTRLLSDIRMLEAEGGLEAAAAGGQDFTVRVPYAFGVVCSSTGTSTTVSLMPVDSAMFAAPGYSGFALRDGSTGAYSYVSGTAVPTTGTASNCTGGTKPVDLVPAYNGSPAGQMVNLSSAAITAPGRGTLVFLYRRVRYEFKASTSVPGRTGLWRTLVTPNTSEELAAPFNTTARVRFYVLNATTAQNAVPSPLSDTRGLELGLDGMSENTPRGSASPKVTSVTTSVFFENRRD
jgi:prepilin-type N-terminal cleavage/methylation domain-containing protein